MLGNSGNIGKALGSVRGLYIRAYENSSAKSTQVTVVVKIKRGM